MYGFARGRIYPSPTPPGASIWAGGRLAEHQFWVKIRTFNFWIFVDFSPDILQKLRFVNCQKGGTAKEEMHEKQRFRSEHPSKLQSRNCIFYLFDFFQNIEN